MVLPCKAVCQMKRTPGEGAVGMLSSCVLMILTERIQNIYKKLNA